MFFMCISVPNIQSHTILDKHTLMENLLMNITLDEKTAILTIKPNGALKAEDFLLLTTLVDPFIKQQGGLKGILIEAPKFPGWENISAFKAHIRFIKDHQAKIKKIALVTDSVFAEILPKIAGVFVAPQIKHFPAGQADSAKQWIEQ